MNALRHSRRFGRFLAAWLLLWFCAMAVPPAAAVPQHAPHEAHATHHCDERGAVAPKVHAAHDHQGSGPTEHCPLCMHAAAPPSTPTIADMPHAAPAAPAASVDAMVLRVRTDTPPPARAPPARS